VFIDLAAKLAGLWCTIKNIANIKYSNDILKPKIKYYCQFLPCLLYALEACPVIRTDVKSLEFTVTRVLMKIFNTNSKDIVIE